MGGCGFIYYLGVCCDLVWVGDVFFFMRGGGCCGWEFLGSYVLGVERVVYRGYFWGVDMECLEDVGCVWL